MKEFYKFGIMLERVRGDDSPYWQYWRVFSSRCHGPLASTRWGAFTGWLHAMWDCRPWGRRHRDFMRRKKAIEKGLVQP